MTKTMWTFLWMLPNLAASVRKLLKSKTVDESNVNKGRARKSENNKRNRRSIPDFRIGDALSTNTKAKAEARRVGNKCC